MRIDIRRKAGRIDPLWFGHNLEHTRSCVWRGLGGQLLRNRKFIGAAGSDGVAPHWYRVGPPGCLYLCEGPGRKHGMEGSAFTCHFDPEDSRAVQCQRIQSFRRGAACGIGQRGIALVGGRDYEARLALRCDRPLTVRMRIGGAEAFETTAAGENGSRTPDGIKGPGPIFSEHRYVFTARATDDDAHLEITIDEPGVLWVGAASLMPADHFHGMRRDVIALLAEIGVPILRWPGGNFAGSYRWKDGLLPVDRRAPLRGDGILPHTDGFDSHEIGTDEYIALCRELGAEPWITINLSLEGPREAAEWVEYCNGSPETPWGRRRAERGHGEPYRVRFWTLGNEMGWPHMKGPGEPRGYAELAVACAKAMKRADPSIVLVASDGPNKEMWYTTVTDVAGAWFDHVSCHRYTDMTKEYAGEPGRREFARIAAASEDNLRTMRQIRGWVDAHAPEGKRIGISFDEWNVWYAWSRVPGVLEAIHAAGMLSMFCREARDAGMTIGAYFEPVNEGAILVAPDSCRLTPAGEVFALFRAHHGNELIDADGGGVPAPDAVASINEAAGEIVLTLANANLDNDASVDVRFEGLQAITVIEAIALTSADVLPESPLERGPLAAAAAGDRGLSASVPAHAVARVRVRYR